MTIYNTDMMMHGRVIRAHGKDLSKGHVGPSHARPLGRRRRMLHSASKRGTRRLKHHHRLASQLQVAMQSNLQQVHTQWTVLHMCIALSTLLLDDHPTTNASWLHADLYSWISASQRGFTLAPVPQ